MTIQTRTGASSNFRPDIQGLRAIAVLLVMAYHAKIPVGAGFIGVDIFFVISGFVIGSALLREHILTGRINLKQFFIRRFRRLVPAQFFLLIFTLLGSVLVLSPLGPLQTAAITSVAASLNIANAVIDLTTGGYFDAPAELNPLLHMWSLSVEEQFYVVFPLLLITAFWIGKKAHITQAALWITLAFVGLASTALAFLDSYLPPLLAESGFVGFYSPITRVWEFLAGVLVAIWSANSSVGISKFWSVGFGVVGLSLIGIGLVTITPASDFPGVLTLLPVCGTVLLIVSGAIPNAISRYGLSNSMTTSIGDLSYSLYLWHWPLIVFAAALWPESSFALLTAVIISVGLATVSYKYVEQPFRRQANKTLKKLLTQILVLTGIPLVASGGIWLTANSVLASGIEEFSARPPGYDLGCHGPTALGEELGVCEWINAESDYSRPIVLVGDSHAAHFTDGLIIAAKDLNRNLLVATASACPYVPGLTVNRTDRDDSECLHWNNQVREWLSEIEPSTVILAGMDYYWLMDGWEIGIREPLRVIDPANRVAAYGASQDAAIAELQASGHTVILVDDVPSWLGAYTWSLDTCTALEIATGCNQEMPISVFLHERQAIKVIRAELSENRAITVVNFDQYICPEGTCNTRQSDMWLYRDHEHLSNGFSKTLASQWAETLRDE